MDQGEAGLRAEVGRLRDRPVSPAELERAKTQLIAAALRERETVEGRGSVLGQAITLEGDAGRANDAVTRLQAVTAADVQRVARLYLSDDRRMVIRYQAETARPAGQPAADLAGASARVAAASAPGQAAPTPPSPPAARQPPPPPGAPVKASLPSPVERTLANGLRVIVAKSTDLPLVTAELTVRTGGAADPAGRAGLAELTAGLLNKGAGSRSATDVARDIEALGGSLEAGASWDGSQVTLGVMADKLAAAMPIMADVVRRPTFAPEELELARQQSLDSLAVELQQPGDIGRYVASVALFGGTPYGHALAGTPASLKAIGRADVVALHDAYYRPDNAVLVLVGDIEPEAGFALAERTFGDWKAPASPTPAVQVPAPTAPRRVIVVDLPGTGQASVGVGLPGIARSDPRYYAGVVTNAALGGGYSARLNAEIRIKRGLSYGAGSALDARRFTGPFLARVQTKNESAPEVVDLVLAEIARLRSDPIAQEELTARKASLTGGYGRNLETTEGLARTLGSYALQGIPLSEIGRYEDSVRAVTPEAARAFAQSTLDPAKADIIVVGDAKQFLAPLKAKFPDLEVIKATDLDLDSPGLRKKP